MANKVFMTPHVGLGMPVAPLVFSSNEAATTSPDHAQSGPLFNEI